MFYSFLPLLHVNTQSAIRSGLVLMLLARSIWVQSTLWCCIPHSGSMSPRLSPLLIPSALPAPTQSRGCSPPLRPKAPAPASMTFCRPIMLLTQPPAPAQHHIMGDGMTKWLLSAPVTAPQPYIPKLIKMAPFVFSSPTLLFVYTNLFQTRAHKSNWFRETSTFTDSSKLQEMFMKILQQDSFQIRSDMRMTLRNIRHILSCKPASERCSIFTVYCSAVLFYKLC